MQNRRLLNKAHSFSPSLAVQFTRGVQRLSSGPMARVRHSIPENVGLTVDLTADVFLGAGVRPHTVGCGRGQGVRQSGVHQRRRVRPGAGPERRGQAEAVHRRDDRLPLGGHRQVQRDAAHRRHAQHAGHTARGRPVPVNATAEGT